MAISPFRATQLIVVFACVLFLATFPSSFPPSESDSALRTLGGIFIVFLLIARPIREIAQGFRDGWKSHEPPERKPPKAASSVIPMIFNCDGFFQPTPLAVLGIIAALLFGRRLPEFAGYLGKRLAAFPFWRLFRSDGEEPGAGFARLEPPDIPRPPAEVGLTPPESEDY